MYTLIQTAKLNDVDPQAWLADALTRIADMPQSRLGELLPWNWRSPPRCRRPLDRGPRTAIDTFSLMNAPLDIGLSSALKQMRNTLGRHRTTEVIPLHLIAIVFAQKCDLIVSFNALGDNPQF